MCSSINLLWHRRNIQWRSYQLNVAVFSYSSMAVAWRCNGGNGWLSQHPSISYIGINGKCPSVAGWLAGVSSRGSMANGVSMAANGWLAINLYNLMSMKAMCGGGNGI
jgi:hypothetical protein